MSTATMFLSVYDSRKFSFHALDTTHDKAKRALVKTLQAHARQYDLEPNWFYADDVFVVELPVGVGTRDWAPIHPNSTEA